MSQINIFDEIIVDNFAGGGGASTGIELAAGRPVTIAINHDPDAILLHKTNHPYTTHLQASVWDVDPVAECQGRPVGMEYAKSIKGWFWIGGQSGCGKTHLCTGICREALLRGFEVVYMMWRDDAPRLKAAINSEEYPAMVDQYKKAPVLYIDDLFKTGKNGDAKVMPTSADINLAYEIINFRCVGKLPTIISSEFLQRELIDIDEALTGRIVQMSGGNSFNIKPDRAKNYRLRGMVEL